MEVWSAYWGLEMLICVSEDKQRVWRDRECNSGPPANSGPLV